MIKKGGGGYNVKKNINYSVVQYNVSEERH